MKPQTRNEAITVTELSTLPTTGDECPLCEDGVFLKDGYERICDTCQHSPSYDTRVETVTEWDSHRKEIDESDGRAPLVGGYKDAYWGTGAYEFSPEDGFTF